MGKGKRNRNNKGNKKDTKQPQDDAESSMQAQANSGADSGNSDIFTQPSDHDVDDVRESVESLGMADKLDDESRRTSHETNDDPLPVSAEHPIREHLDPTTVPDSGPVQSFDQDVRAKWRLLLKEVRKHDAVTMDEDIMPGFANTANDVNGFFVRTNYLSVDFKKVANEEKDTSKNNPANRLFIYEIQGIEALDAAATKAKKRVLIETMLHRCPLLYHQRAFFATDYQKKIVAWGDLSVWDSADFGLACPGDTLAEVQIENFNPKSPGSGSKSLGLKLVHTETYTFDKVDDFVGGAGDAAAASYKNMNEALHILLSAALQDKSGKKILQATSSKIYAKEGVYALGGDPNRPHNKVAVRGYTYAYQQGMVTHLVNVKPIMGVFHAPMLVSDYIAKDTTLQDDLNHVRVWVNFERTNAKDDDRSLDDPKRRTKTITGFGSKSAGVQVAYYQSGKPVTVYEHFSSMYHGRFSGTKQSICVNLGGSTAPTRDEDGDQIWFMAEDLWILPYQQFRDTLSSDLTSEVIKVACRQPDEHQRAVANEFVDLLGIANASEIEDMPDALKKSNIRIYPQLINVPAYRAEIPKVHYGTDEALPNNGKGKDWIEDLRQTAKWQLMSQNFVSKAKFSGPAFFIIPSRGMRYEEASRSTYLKFFHEQYTVNGLKGLAEKFPGLEQSNHTILQNYSDQEMDRAILAALKQTPGLVVLILPRNNKDHQRNYATFKKLCDQKYGVTSLCLCETKIKSQFDKGPLPPTINDYHRFSAYVRNIGMKLNVRLGHVNHQVTGLDEKIPGGSKGLMIIGADVLHPGKGTTHEYTPSIAAVVGSVDDTFYHMLGSARAQPGGQEIISGMESMVMERLQAYKKKNDDRLPDRILYYRDGIDQGQFSKVQSVEMAAIRTAWNRVAGIDPTASSKDDLKITVVVVTKRHHTRLYPTSTSTKERLTNGNCIPGTIVESTITMPYHFDFYLISHNAIKGTARPAHYIVLKNGIDFTQAQMHNLTNMLCYNYCRSTTAVSYVPAAYYADHLCERVRDYLKPLFDRDPGYGGTQNQVQSQVDAMWTAGGGRAGGNPWHSNMDEVMFWM